MQEHAKTYNPDVNISTNDYKLKVEHKFTKDDLKQLSLIQPDDQICEDDDFPGKLQFLKARMNLIKQFHQ